MNKEIINLCKDVIIEEGNISRVDCYNIRCNECPFECINANDNHECEERSAKANLKIAHEYIKNNEVVNPNIEIGDIIIFHNVKIQKDSVYKVEAILKCIDSIDNKEKATNVYYCSDTTEPNTIECAYVLERDIKEIYKRVKGE